MGDYSILKVVRLFVSLFACFVRGCTSGRVSARSPAYMIGGAGIVQFGRAYD